MIFLHGSTGPSHHVYHPLEFVPLVVVAGWLLPLFPDAIWEIREGDPWH